MIKKSTRLFLAALLALGVSTACLLFIPLLQQNTIQYVLAGAFWLFLILEMVLLGIGNSLRRKIERMSPHLKCRRGAGKIGILCFMQNQEAMINDAVLLVAAIYLIVVSILLPTSVVPVLIGIIVVYVSFHLHCILNGILYKSLKFYQMVIKKKERMK